MSKGGTNSTHLSILIRSVKAKNIHQIFIVKKSGKIEIAGIEPAETTTKAPPL